MAKPIKETPVLVGKDARTFTQKMNEAKKNVIEKETLKRMEANFQKIKALVKNG